MNNNSSTKLWTDTATELVDIWTETGSLMWKSWFDLMSSVPTSNPISQTTPEFTEVTQRFLDNRELVIRFLKLSVDAWKDIFPKIEKGDDWQQILAKSIEQMQQQLTSYSQGSLQISKDSAELWKLYLQQMQKFNQLWVDPLGLFSQTFGR